MLSDYLSRLLRKIRNGQQRRTANRQAKLRLEVLEDRWVPATLHVGSNETYTTIMAAVNAASSGDRILIDSGTYQEQVLVNKNIELKGQGNSVHIKAPTNLGTPTASNPDAIVRVTGTGVSAKINHLTIEGASSSGTPNLLYGIRVDGGAFAEIKNNTITKIIDSSDSSQGVAIDVGHGGNGQSGSDGSGSQVGRADIENNTISNYQRAGIVVDNIGSRADIENNCIFASSSFVSDSQTGVQVSYGAAADIENNSISGNFNDTDGCGVLLVSPGAYQLSNCDNDAGDYFITIVKNNSITGNDYGIFGSSVVSTLSGQPASANIKDNWLACNTYVGMEFDNSSNLYVKNNAASWNGSDNTADGGIYLFNSTSNTFINNWCIGNDGSGIYVNANSTGNTFTNNHCFWNDYDTTAGNADVVDLSVGGGTAGTGNAWNNDHGSTFITISGESVFS